MASRKTIGIFAGGGGRENLQTGENEQTNQDKFNWNRFLMPIANHSNRCLSALALWRQLSPHRTWTVQGSQWTDNRHTDGKQTDVVGRPACQLPRWQEYEHGHPARVQRQTDLPWDSSGWSPQGIPFLWKARNPQQLESLGSPVAASWSYRSWWEASGDKQHPAGEKLAFQEAESTQYSGPAPSSQYTNHGAIRSLSGRRQPFS